MNSLHKKISCMDLSPGFRIIFLIRKHKKNTKGKEVKTMNKRYLLVTAAAALSTALQMTGCASLEEAAKKGQHFIAYKNEEMDIRQNGRMYSDFQTTYRTYERKRDAWKENNPGKVVDKKTILAHTAYLNRAAALPVESNDTNRNIYRLRTSDLNDFNYYFQKNDLEGCRKKSSHTLRRFAYGLEQNKRILKDLQFRLSVVDDAFANKSHMLNPDTRSWQNNRNYINKRIQDIQSANAQLEKAIDEVKTKINTRAKAAADKKAALETNRKDPAFQYPKKNICKSSVPLWRDIKSGMNLFMLKNVKKHRDGLVTYSDSMKVLGGVCKIEENIGTIQFCYARENKTPANTGVIFGLTFSPKDPKMSNALFEKFKKEMPNATVKKQTIERSKRSCQNYFTRYEIDHVIILKEGAKVVKITRCEYKTTFTDAYRRLLPDRQKYLTDEFYDPSSKRREREKWNAARRQVHSFAFASRGISKKDFYNCANVSCDVNIYDEQQYKAYNRFYQKAQKNDSQQDLKKRQQQLDF